MMGLSIKTQWKTQPEKLDVPQQKKEWIIGIPRPPKEESRIPLVPSAIKVLSSLGFRFLVESKAGEKAGYSDRDLAENGADISHSREEVFGSDVILQAFPPQKTDVDFMKSGQLLISPLHVGALQLEVIRSEEHTSELQSRGHLVCRLLLEKKKSVFFIGTIMKYIVED